LLSATRDSNLHTNKNDIKRLKEKEPGLQMKRAVGQRQRKRKRESD